MPRVRAFQPRLPLRIKYNAEKKYRAKQLARLPRQLQLGFQHATPGEKFNRERGFGYHQIGRMRGVTEGEKRPVVVEKALFFYSFL